MNDSPTDNQFCTHVIKFRKSQGSRVCNIGAIYKNSLDEPRCGKHVDCKPSSSTTAAVTEEKPKENIPVPSVTCIPTDDMELLYSLTLGRPSLGYSITSRVVDEQAMLRFICNLRNKIDHNSDIVHLYTSITEDYSIFDGNVFFRYDSKFVDDLEYEFDNIDD